jgi:hypothetical protein
MTLAIPLSFAESTARERVEHLSTPAPSRS